MDHRADTELCGARLRALRRGPLHALAPETFRTLFSTSSLEALPAGRVLWHDDGDVPVCGTLVDGILRHQRCSADGRRQILDLALPGDLLGPEKGRGRGFTLETAAPALFCRFRPQVFERLLAEDSALREALYAATAVKLERLHWLTWAIGALHPDQRLAAFLLAARGWMPMEGRADGSAVLSLSISRRDIADLLATSVESVCRILKAMERRGEIALNGPARIHLLDVRALRARSQQKQVAARATLALPPVGHRVGVASGAFALSFVNAPGT